MIEDARELPEGAELGADVCIVGAGPAGLTIAFELAGSGADVVVLESGGRQPGAGAEELTRGENADPRYYRLEQTRLRAFGGSSNHWEETSGLRARPLDPIDLRPRPEIDRGGWPFGREVLDPFYERAHGYLGLGPFDYTLDRWHDPAVGALPVTDDVTTAMFQLGPLDSFRRRYDDVVALDDVRLLLHATALELITDAAGTSVERVDVTSGGRRRFSVRARRVVLACGGIDNPRLLLLSSRTVPGGLGNEHDLVGRFFMEHPHVRTGVVVPSSSDLFDRLAVYERRRPEPDVEVFGMLTPTPSALEREEILASAWSVHPASRALVTPAARAMLELKELRRRRRAAPEDRDIVGPLVARPDQVVAAAWDAVRRRRGRSTPDVLQLHVMSEQEPNPDSRVTLGSGRDRFGQPVARVDWRLTDRDRRSIRVAQELLDAHLRDAGLGHVEQLFGDEYPTTAWGGGFHHLGTTRMDADPERGVVDVDGRVHGVENAYVTGQSVFPTGGYANPTLTVLALALRLADHLRT